MAAGWFGDNTLDHRDQTLDTPAGPSLSTTTRQDSQCHRMAAENNSHLIIKVTQSNPGGSISILTKTSNIFLPSHHVGVGSARHALAGVEVEEFVDLWGGQSVSNLQLLNNKHLPGERLFATGTHTDHSCHWPLPIRSSHRPWVSLMLEGHLGNKTWGICWKEHCEKCRVPRYLIASFSSSELGVHD